MKEDTLMEEAIASAELADEMNPITQLLKEREELFNQKVALEKFTEYSKDKLGCCGGDYCEGNHNENIKAFQGETFALLLYTVREMLKDMKRTDDEALQDVIDKLNNHD